MAFATRRRFRSARGFRGGLREPLMWDRFPGATQGDNSGVFAALISVVFFDPTTIVAGNQDLRVTVRRVHLGFLYKATLTAGAQIPLLLTAGIYPTRVSETIRAPAFTAAADQRTDWMWHGTYSVFPGAAAATVLINPGANTLNGADVVDVRAMRKLDQDEQLVLVMSLSRQDPAVDAAPTITRQALAVSASTLYSRTKR